MKIFGMSRFYEYHTHAAAYLEMCYFSIYLMIWKLDLNFLLSSIMNDRSTNLLFNNYFFLINFCIKVWETVYECLENFNYIKLELTNILLNKKII